MEQYRKYTERDPKTGQPKKEAYPAGTPSNKLFNILESYAEQRRKILEAERKKYNVDYLGRYKGGGKKETNPRNNLISSSKGKTRPQRKCPWPPWSFP